MKNIVKNQFYNQNSQLFTERSKGDYKLDIVNKNIYKPKFNILNLGGL